MLGSEKSVLKGLNDKKGKTKGQRKRDLTVFVVWSYLAISYVHHDYDSATGVYYQILLEKIIFRFA